MMVSTVFAGINVLLVAALAYVYGKNAVKMPSSFTVGLLLFALLFLIHNVVALYYGLTMMPLYEESVEGYVRIFTILQTLAFAILNWVTWR
jgi:hypothetical protein